MERELDHLRALNAQLDGVSSALEHTGALLARMGANARNSRDTLALYARVQTASKANEGLLAVESGNALDNELNDARARVAALRMQLERMESRS